MHSSRILTLVLIALLMAFGIHVMNMRTDGLRVDLTEDNLFSLTEGTEEILEKMNKDGVKPIEIKLYFSNNLGKQLPKFIKNFIVYEDYVRNLLKEYARKSNGKIEVSFIDPKVDSDAYQDAEDYGLDGKQVNQEGDKFFFGMAFLTQTGSRDVIDFLWPNKQESIEYEISKRIYNLVWPDKKKIGIVSSIEPIQDNSNPYMAQLLRAQGKEPKDSWLMMKLLQEEYEVAPIKDSDHINKDEFDLVVVIHPKGLSEKMLWALDEWVVTGGNTMVFLDPYSIEDQAPQNPQQPFAQYQYQPASDMPKLLEKWGLYRKADEFAADFQLAVKRPTTPGGPAQNVIIDMMISEQTRNQTMADHPINQGLSDIRLIFPGALYKKDDAAGSFTPLITTTTQSDVLTIKPGFGGQELAYTDLGQPAKLLDRFRPSNEQYVLAYMIQGQMPSAYPEGASFAASTPEPPPGLPPGVQMPPDENAEMITKEAVAQDQHAESTILVFGDVDLLSDQIAFQQSFFGTAAANDNHKLFMNSVDYLLGSRELMKVRSRSMIQRPFELFQQIEAQADARLLEKEQKLRGDIERFQEQIREKQGSLNQKNAALFQKEMADEVEALNAKISEAKRELRDIRKQKRAEIERQETLIKATTLWVMPTLVMIMGLGVFFKRRAEAKQSRQGGRS